MDSNCRSTDFPEWVRNHEKALRQYCSALTRSSWDGEDLAQETWLKVWTIVSVKEEQVQLARSYLFRTARNSWIDRIRRKSTLLSKQSVEELDLPQQQLDYVAIWTAMETLVTHLRANQRIVLLLVDILKYTAAESAELLNTTEGAVKATLHRARIKLRRLADHHKEIDNIIEKAERLAIPKIHSNSPSVDSIIYAYVEAFRKHNTEALIMLMNETDPHELIPILNEKISPVEQRRSSKQVENQSFQMIMVA